MPELTQQQRTAIDLFRQISDVLGIPSLGKPLSKQMRWTLPRPDEKALADHSGSLDEEQAAYGRTPPSKEDKAGNSYGKDSPKQTGRK